LSDSRFVKGASLVQTDRKVSIDGSPSRRQMLSPPAQHNCCPVRLAASRGWPLPKPFE
jgi:hypothetical protein